MAGKMITDLQLGGAVDEYCAANGMLHSHGEEKPYKITIFKETPQPGDPMLWVEDGHFRCSDTEFGLSFASEWLQEATKGPNLPAGRGEHNSPAARRSAPTGAQGSALAAVRDCQATEKATYSTGKDRKAASAKTNIAALMESGGSLKIIGREHTPTYIEVTVRASLMSGQCADSSISIWKQEYLAKKAWDWIVKVLMDTPGIVTGTDEYGMPEFAEGATIKVRISDEGKSVLVSLPAKIALWRELAREWQFASRVCETKAYSRAADMLLRGDFQSREELAEEQAEVDGIQEDKPGAQ